MLLLLLLLLLYVMFATRSYNRRKAFHGEIHPNPLVTELLPR